MRGPGPERPIHRKSGCPKSRFWYLGSHFAICVSFADNFNQLSHLQNHREQAAISPDAGFVLSALQCGTVWSTFGYGRDEDFDFRTRRDRGGLVLIQFFGFLLTAYVMSLRI
jgi:hypothetical protein